MAPLRHGLPLLAAVLALAPGRALAQAPSDARLRVTGAAGAEHVTLCGQRAAVLRGGDLRCLRCGPEELGGGDLVCLEGTRIVERGCPQIELAPECDPALAARLLGP